MSVLLQGLNILSNQADSMHPDPDGIEERLRASVLILCSGASLPLRLERAYTDHLQRIPVDAMPAPLRARFGELLADLSYGGETIAEGLARMNADDQWRLAERVVALYGEACRHFPAEA